MVFMADDDFDDEDDMDKEELDAELVLEEDDEGL